MPEAQAVFGIGLDNALDNFLGLISFHCIPGPAFDGRYVLELRAPDTQREALRFSGLVPGERTDVHIHQALLPAGPRTISFRLVDAAGRALFEQDFKLSLREKNDLGLRVGRALQEFGTPWAYIGHCDSGYYPFSRVGRDLTPWFDRDDAGQYLERLRSEKVVNDREAELLREFLSKGILIVEDAIPHRLIDAANAEIDDAISKGWQGYQLGSSQRLEHLHLHYPNVRKLWLHPAHRRWTDLLFGVTARPCQTLTYVYGSQQAVHQDTIHLTTFPPGHMFGVWMALQDVVPDSGELVYYEGSHRERRLYLRDLQVGKTRFPADWPPFESKALPAWSEMASRHTARVFRPRKGTLAIWHGNLLHGGLPRNDPALQRRSVVVHTYAHGCVAFADSLGITAVAAPLDSLEKRRFLRFFG